MATKSFLDVLAANLDVRRRAQELEENRNLDPERLRNLQLRNELLVHHTRRVAAEADILENERDELLVHHTRPVAAEADILENERDELRGLAPSQPDDAETSTERYWRTAGELTSRDFAELLSDPMWRLLSYGGGELEIYREEDDQDEPESD